MANNTDKSILTTAGKALLAQLNAEEKALVIDKMIFANVPNQQDYPQPDDVVPTNHVVHQEQVEQRGRLSPDSVIYTSTMTSEIGPFDFNWTGSYCSEYGVLVTIEHHALTPKVPEEPGVAGNTLVRSVVLEYKNIAEITNISIDASTWQYNASKRLEKMDNDVALSIVDQNGKDWFIDEGFLVTRSNSSYRIQAGTGYVSGNRVAMEFDRDVQVPNKPSFIYIDAHREGTPTGEQVTIFSFIVTSSELDDYVDNSTGKSIPHHVAKIARVMLDESVVDLRKDRSSAEKSWVVDEESKQTAMLSNQNLMVVEYGIYGQQLKGIETIQINEYPIGKKSIWYAWEKPSGILLDFLDNGDYGTAKAVTDEGEYEFVTKTVFDDRLKGLFVGWGADRKGLKPCNDALSKIKQEAANKIVYLTPDGTYYFEGNRPDLTGVRWFAYDGAKITVDANPNTKEMQLLTDVTINNVVHKTNMKKHRNQQNEYLVACSNALKRRSISKPDAIRFDDESVMLAGISGVNEFREFTGFNLGTYIGWESDFSSNQEGAFLNVEEGTLFECAYRHIGEVQGTNSEFRGPTVVSGDLRVDFSVYVGQPIARLITQPGDAKQIELPNGGAYSLATDGAIFMGVRVVGKTAEFYINGTLFAEHQFNSKPDKIGFLTSWQNSSKCQILNLTKTCQKETVSSKPVSIAIVGDSISYGAWCTDSYDQILKKTLEHSGVGDVTTVNYAESGSATSNWIEGGSIDITTKDLSGVDYCLVMLGTNDVQGGVSGLLFESNLREILGHLKSLNIVPILGIFPVWTKREVSGVHGVETKNYEKGGWHRQLVRYVAAELGVYIADVCSHFGSNIKWYGDNIHPTEYGQISIASAFAEVIISDRSGKPTDNHLWKDKSLELNRPWETISGYEEPRVSIRDSHVVIGGGITGGQDNSVVFVLPDFARPNGNKVFTVWCNDSSGTPGFARITVLTSGEVKISQSTVTPFVIFLDGINYRV